jgi:hypothetical protein
VASDRVVDDSDRLRPSLSTPNLIAFLDTDVLDIELGLIPLADVGLLVHDESAEVAGVEHHDVGGLGLEIDVHEGAYQDAETTEVGVAGDLEGGAYGDSLAGCKDNLGSIYIVDISAILWS